MCKEKKRYFCQIILIVIPYRPCETAAHGNLCEYFLCLKRPFIVQLKSCFIDLSTYDFQLVVSHNSINGIVYYAVEYNLGKFTVIPQE